MPNPKIIKLTHLFLFFSLVLTAQVPNILFYDKLWKICGIEDASFYRVYLTNEKNEIVDTVRDYDMDRALYWKGRMSYIDVKDEEKSISFGLCTSYDKKGFKTM